MRSLIVAGILTSLLILFTINGCESESPSGVSPEDLPATPSGLMADSISHDLLRLAWVDNSHNESGFRIERRIGSGSDWTEVDRTDQDITTWEDLNLDEYEQYDYRLDAFNDHGFSDDYDELTAYTAIKPPVELSVQEVSHNKIDLTWTDRSSIEDGYRIERQVSEGDHWERIADLISNELEYSDTNLPPSTIYNYRICAYKNREYSAFSNEVSGATYESPVLIVNSLVLNLNSEAVLDTALISNGGGSQLDWTAEILDTEQGWLSIVDGASGTDAGAIVFNATTNSGELRSSVTMVSAPGSIGSPIIITVIQAAAPPILEVSTTLLDVGYEAGTASFVINNVGAGTMNWIMTKDSDWLSISSTSGSNDSEITVSYDPNPRNERSSEITITAPGAIPPTVTITLSQEASPPVLVLSDEDVDVPYIEGSIPIAISNGGGGVLSWSITIHSDWIQAEPLSGAAGDTVMISYSANQGDERSSELTFTVPGAIQPVVILTLTQEDAPVSVMVTPDPVSIGNFASTVDLTVSNAGGGVMNWTVFEAVDWLTVSPTYGENEGIITVTYDSNDGNERDGEIVVNAINSIPPSVTVRVVQDSEHGSILSIDPDHARQNETLTVSITGRGTHFRFLTEYGTAILQRGDDRVQSDLTNVLSDTVMEARFTIPWFATPDMWDFKVEDINDYEIMLLESFRIDR